MDRLARDLLAVDLEGIDHAVRLASLRLFEKVDLAAHCRPEPSNRLRQYSEPTIRVDSQRSQPGAVVTLIDRDTTRGRDQGNVVDQIRLVPGGDLSTDLRPAAPPAALMRGEGPRFPVTSTQAASRQLQGPDHG